MFSIISGGNLARVPPRLSELSFAATSLHVFAAVCTPFGAAASPAKWGLRGDACVLAVRGICGISLLTFARYQN
jgi:hypothetical protein